MNQPHRPPTRLHPVLHTRLLMAAAAATALPAWALDISGASTIQPLVAQLVPLYTSAGGEAVKLAAGGSGAGIKNTLAGTAQIGMVSRALSAEEKAQLQHTTIGIDALAVIVHQSNPLDELSKAQLTDLYSGRIDNWQALGGPALPVQRVSKEVGRSTLELFEHYTGLLSADRPAKPGTAVKPQISKDAFVVGSNLEALTLVGGLPGAVGYVSVGTAQSLKAAGMPIKVLALEKVVPSNASIQDRSYPIVRELNLVYRDTPKPVADFLSVALGAQGQAAAAKLGFVPVNGR